MLPLLGFLRETHIELFAVFVNCNIFQHIFVHNIFKIVPTHPLPLFNYIERKVSCKVNNVLSVDRK